MVDVMNKNPIINVNIADKSSIEKLGALGPLPEDGKAVSGCLTKLQPIEVLQEGIVSFSLTDHQIKRRLYRYIAQQDQLPRDVLSDMVVLNCQCFYVPCQVYDGCYQADWQAEFGYIPWMVSCGESSNDNLIWNHEQGENEGWFNVPVYMGDQLPENAIRLLAECCIKNMPLQFDTSILNHFFQKSRTFLLKEQMAIRSQEQVAYVIDRQIKQLYAKGDYQRAWQWQINQLNCTVRRVWIPMGQVTFQYHGKEYNFWCLDINGSHEVCDELPIGSGYIHQIAVGAIPAGIALAMAIFGFLGLGERTTLNFILMLLVPTLLYGVWRFLSVVFYNKRCQIFVKAIHDADNTKSTSNKLRSFKVPSRPLIVSLMPYDKILLPMLTIIVLILAILVQCYG